MILGDVHWRDVQGKPGWHWATVTSTNAGVELTVDGDDAPLEVAPDVLAHVGPLTLGDRVYVQIFPGGACVVIGDNTPPGGGGELVVNVLDHGAVPDFTGTPFTGSGTNNLAAFNAAMAACPKGGTILVPPGRYYLSNTWQITKTVRIDCGPGGIEPQADTGTELIFAAGVTGIRVGVSGSVRPDGAVLGPLKLTSKSQGSGAGVGVLIKNAQRVMVPAGIGVYYFGSHGFFVDGSVEGDLSNIGTFTRVHAYDNGGDGIRCEGDDAQANIFIKPDVVANKGWGINVEGSAHNVFDAPHADQQYGGSPGAFRDNGNATDWRHVYSEGGAPMLLDTGSLFAKVTMSNYGKPVFTDATAGKTALVTDEWGAQGEIKVSGRTTGARYQFEVDGWNGAWATFQKRDAAGGFEKLIWSTDPDGNFTFGGQVITIPGWLKIGGLFLRDNAGALEKSTDGSTWTAV